MVTNRIKKISDLSNKNKTTSKPSQIYQPCAAASQSEFCDHLYQKLHLSLAEQELNILPVINILKSSFVTLIRSLRTMILSKT